VQDTDGILERKEKKKNKEKKKRVRSTTRGTGMSVKKWKD
jgi:hypothetical protein